MKWCKTSMKAHQMKSAWKIWYLRTYVRTREAFFTKCSRLRIIRRNQGIYISISQKTKYSTHKMERIYYMIVNLHWEGDIGRQFVLSPAWFRYTIVALIGGGASLFLRGAGNCGGSNLGEACFRIKRVHRLVFLRNLVNCRVVNCVSGGLCES